VVLARSARPDDNNLSLSTYPNPAEQFTLVQFDAPVEGTYSYELVDLEGRIILSYPFTAVAGKNEFELDLKNFKSGIYLLRVFGNDTALTSRLVIQ
jgi:hypothetical protein